MVAQRCWSPRKIQKTSEIEIRPGSTTLSHLKTHDTEEGAQHVKRSNVRAPVKLHVRAKFFIFALKFNSDLCIAALYVQVRTQRRLRCPDQPGPRHDPNPNPNPNPDPNPNPNPDSNPNANPSPDPNPNLIPIPHANPTPTRWGALGLLSRSAASVLSIRAILKTLHVRAIIRLVQCAN